MRKIILLLTTSLLVNIAFSQDKDAAEKLVNEGIPYHDKGDYDGAISRYDKALALDKDNLSALSEKAFSLLSLQKYDDAILYCKKALETHPSEDVKTVYVTYGNALDALKRTDESLQVYDEGLKLFPDYYQLYFNKGVTLSSVKKYDEALICFQKAVSINPKHASSHNAIARLQMALKKNIAALLAFCRFLVLEPESNRAKENIELLKKIVKANVEKTGKNSININLDPSVLGDTTAEGKPKENSFSLTELNLQMSSALDYDDKYSKETDVEQFIRKMETVFGTLEETNKDNFGFYWTYYVPYFKEMNDKKFIKVFSYVAFVSSGKPEVVSWLKEHQSEVDDFYAWSKSFSWSKQ